MSNFFAYSACMILPLVLFTPRKICVKSKFAKFLTKFILKISISTIPNIYFMKLHFIMSIKIFIDIVNVDTFFYKFGQSRGTLTSDKTYMHNAD